MTDVQQNNRLIAEFMGLQNEEANGIVFVRDGAQTKAILYHKDWNDLMPVVEKINSIWGNGVIIAKDYVTVWYCSPGMSVRKPIIDIKQTGDLIDAVYQAVVEFIEWHNEKNSKK